MPDILDITLLGGVAVRRGGTPLGAASSRALALLAFLALNEGVPQSRSHLAGLFWPDSSEVQARTNLRRELHQLRAMLDFDECLLVDAQTLAYRDVEGCRLDIRSFATARAAALLADRDGSATQLLACAQEAVELFRGPLLPGYYDDWVIERRDLLAQQCVDLCDRAVAAAGSMRDHARALGYARRRVQLAPLEEVGYRQLMEVQATAGDRAGAVTTYHRCASVLEQELGVSPSRTTTQAMQAILNSGAPRESDPAEHTPVETTPTSDRGGVIGRSRELEILFARWEAARDGRPGLAVVSGGAGVGKSRLVAELGAYAARQGAVVATARCFGTSERLALAPVADWLRSPQLRAAESALDDVWRFEVDRLVPRAAATDGTASTSRAKVDAWQRVRFYEGLARAVLVVGRPVLLVLDDLQWCDSETMLWLSFLLHLASDGQVFVAVTVRDEELDQNLDVMTALRSLRSAGLVSDLLLGPLGPDETAAMAEQILGRPLASEDLALLQTTTGGYPLYVVETVRGISSGAPGAEAPEDLNQVLRQRFADTSEDARQIVGLAAAVGREFSLELLIEASDQDGDTVVRAVDELWRRKILRQSGAGYDFTHDLIRAAAYGVVAPAQRWLHHRRLAQALELLHSGRLEDVAGQLALHYASSGRPDRAVPFYATAAEGAGKVFASAEAIRLLRLALDQLAQLPPGRDRDARELELLQAISPPLNALYGYASPQLEEVLVRLERLAESLGQTRSHIAALVALWACRYVRGEIAESHRIASRALELSDLVPELAGQAHFAMAGACTSLGQHELAVMHFDLARDLSIGAVSLTVGTRPEVHAQAWAAHARWLLGDPEGARRACVDAIRRAHEVQHPYSLAVALAYAAITYQLLADLPALDDVLAELSDTCARYEIAYYREWALVLSGWREGGADGIARLRTGLSNLTNEHALARMPYWLSLLAQIHESLGETAAARATLDAAHVAAVQRDDKWWLPETLRLSAAYQSPDRAVVTLREATQLAASHASVVLVQRCQDDLTRIGAERYPSARPVRGERLPNGPLVGSD